MNKKGFVLAETLVVTIFVLLIFTILYNNAVPLLGRYQQLSYYDDLDMTYDLYHIRKLVESDTNYETIVNSNYTILQCSNGTIANYTECNNLYEALDIVYSTDINVNDEVIFLKKSGINALKNDPLVSEQVKEYASYVDLPNNSLILKNDGYISFLNIYPPNAPEIIISVNGTTFSTGYLKNSKVTISCDMESGINTFSTTLNGNSSGIDITNTSTSRVREITLSNSGIQVVTGTCLGSNGKETSKTMTYTVFD